ncbi:hypothetical protein KP509_31G053500 [Ceratopteris richardii]|nr:hypothetical protein KP509_31G053500 [Ceratopteris richardii]
MDDSDVFSTEGNTLPSTPTWAIASVMATFVFISLLLEHFIRYVTRCLARTRKRSLYQSLERIKEELMLLGFISLFMSVLATVFLEICVDESSYNRQVTICKQSMHLNEDLQEKNGFFLFYRYVIDHHTRSEHMCPKGKRPFVSFEDIHEIHGLLFVTAATHIVYSCMTVRFALLKVWSWSSWENDAHGDSYNNFADISKEASLDRHFLFTLYHTSKPWNFKRFLVWMACFIRQFSNAIDRADYLTIRSGFIAAHKLDRTYNFHTYIVRCMEDDFTRIVGIRY